MTIPTRGETMTNITAQSLSILNTELLIKELVRERSDHLQWGPQDRNIYEGILLDLVRMARQEALHPMLKVVDTLIDIILDSRLNDLDDAARDAYSADLDLLVILAKTEKIREIKDDVARATGLHDPTAPYGF
jgi:hypothetical protein